MYKEVKQTLHAAYGFPKTYPTDVWYGCVRQHYSKLVAKAFEMLEKTHNLNKAIALAIIFNIDTLEEIEQCIPDEDCDDAWDDWDEVDLNEEYDYDDENSDEDEDEDEGEEDENCNENSSPIVVIRANYHSPYHSDLNQEFYVSCHASEVNAILNRIEDMRQKWIAVRMRSNYVHTIANVIELEFDCKISKANDSKAIHFQAVI